MSVVSLNDVDIYYEEKGCGEPVFLLAGLMSDSQSWLPASTILSKKFRVITSDNRGVGRSTQDGECSIRLMAEDILALADYLQLDTFKLVGHSMGGFIALELARMAADRVESLVLVASSAKNSLANNRLFESWLKSREEGEDLYSWFAEVFEWIFSEHVTRNRVTLKTFLDYSVSYPYPQTLEGFRKQLEAIREFDISPKLRDILVPTLVLCAGKDRLFSEAVVRCELDPLPRKEFILLPDAAHAIHAEYPEEFTEVIAGYFESARSS